MSVPDELVDPGPYAGGRSVLWARGVILRRRVPRSGRRDAKGGDPLLRGVGLHLHRAESLTVTGPPGSGKSALLRCLAGIEPPDEGEVWFAGRRVYPLAAGQRAALRRTSFGIVPQGVGLVAELTVEENVVLPLLDAGDFTRAQAAAAAAAWLQRLELTECAALRARSLDDETARRVAVARALVASPSVVVADDPAAGLAASQADRLLRILRTVSRSHGIALVVTGRDAAIARHTDRHLVLDDGRLVSPRVSAALAAATSDKAADLTRSGGRRSGTVSAAGALIGGARPGQPSPGRDDALPSGRGPRAVPLFKSADR